MPTRKEIECELRQLREAAKAGPGAGLQKRRRDIEYAIRNPNGRNESGASLDADNASGRNELAALNHPGRPDGVNLFNGMDPDGTLGPRNSLSRSRLSQPPKPQPSSGRRVTPEAEVPDAEEPAALSRAKNPFQTKPTPY